MKERKKEVTKKMKRFFVGNERVPLDTLIGHDDQTSHQTPKDIYRK